MDSLLINLRKYRPRENTDPLENFMTEAFAWLLRRNTGFSMHWLESLNELFDDGEKFMLPTEDVLWSTQDNFDGKYPDMVASWSQTRIIFEHKVWADLHENQLSNYRSYADKQSWDYRLILITARKSQHEQNPDLAICWDLVYKQITQYLNQDDTELESWLLEEFLALLRSEGMGC